ncbi:MULTISPECIES: hypothetical protein [unclassified Parafrankia]|uniref:hypothetical protein n=1 Tax=unclassified Parafrankia TaxID=2994368 RepID=UPI000DA5B348|nr:MULTISPECIES: hypothetical protein [unclassified Parafrankia]TCJ36637.1 hypothetical protein E0504_22280 [Parafrankia sp. BMG5.11]SQD95846.1 conserved hypothetical protein [Parafrankia sp. Ea1.12]
MIKPQVNAPSEELVRKIFSSNERWGWEYAPPHPATAHHEAFHPPTRVQLPVPDLRGLEFRRRQLSGKVWRPIVGGLFLLGGLGALAESPSGVGPLLIGVVLLAWYFVPIQTVSKQMKSIQAGHQAEVARREQDFQVAYAAWQQRVHQHDQAEQYRIGSALEFYPLDPERPARIDVFGGTGAGWTSLLATGGTSLLTSGSGILLLDLSELSVGAGLVMLANNADAPISVDVRELPNSLERIGLLGELDLREASELLADAFDADRRGGGDQSLRAIDLNILRSVASSIEAPLTFARLAAALRILDNQSSAVHEGVFSDYEVQALQQRMYDLGQRERTVDQISFLRTELETLAGSDASAADVPPAEPAAWWPGGGLRVLATTSSGRGNSGRRKLLTDRILVETLLHQLRGNGHAGLNDVVVIAGADHLGRETLTTLTRQAEAARVRLVLLFKSLSDDAEKLIGTGHSAAIFMRLGNAREASAAADHIGKGFRFVLSQVTNQIGDSFTEGLANSYGEQDGTAFTEGEGRQRGYGPGGGSGGRNWNHSTTTSHSSTWTNTLNVSNTVSRNLGTTLQREKDYTVEPTVLQSLATTAFILVGTSSGPGRVRSGDCNPGLLLLPRVSEQPRDLTGAAPAYGAGSLNQGGATATQQLPAPQREFQHQLPPGYPQQPGYPLPPDYLQQPGYPQQPAQQGPYHPGHSSGTGAHPNQPPHTWPGQK